MYAIEFKRGCVILNVHCSAYVYTDEMEIVMTFHTCFILRKAISPNHYWYKYCISSI